jgi:hypothetical protein
LKNFELMNDKLLMIFLVSFFASHMLFGQVGVHMEKTSNSDFNLNIQQNHKTNSSFPFLSSFVFSVENNTKIKPAKIPLAYSYRDLAPFCKVEVKIEKALKKSFKFRLGTLDYVNYLEQK